MVVYPSKSYLKLIILYYLLLNILYNNFLPHLLPRRFLHNLLHNFLFLAKIFIHIICKFLIGTFHFAFFFCMVNHFTVGSNFNLPTLNFVLELLLSLFIFFITWTIRIKTIFPRS